MYVYDYAYIHYDYGYIHVYWKKNENLVRIILHVTLVTENIFRVSLTSNRKEAHLFHLAREVGKNWRCSRWENDNFTMISEFKYGQTWKIWPFPLSLSFYSTFKRQSMLRNSKDFCWRSFIYKIDGKESKSIQLSVHELSYFKGLHKNQFLVPYSLFNIYINDIFFALKGNDICNFADDTQLRP